MDSLSLWYNDLPPGGKASCALSPVKALPLVTIRIVNPSIDVEGKKILFPVEIESGSYLELSSESGCILYGPKGERLREVEPRGEVPALRRGKNGISFGCEGPKDARPRARVTVIALGEAR